MKWLQIVTSGVTSGTQYLLRVIWFPPEMNVSDLVSNPCESDYVTLKNKKVTAFWTPQPALAKKRHIWYHLVSLKKIVAMWLQCGYMWLHVVTRWYATTRARYGDPMWWAYILWPYASISHHKRNHRAPLSFQKLRLPGFRVQLCEITLWYKMRLFDHQKPFGTKSFLFSM